MFPLYFASGLAFRSVIALVCVSYFLYILYRFAILTAIPIPITTPTPLSSPLSCVRSLFCPLPQHLRFQLLQLILSCPSTGLVPQERLGLQNPSLYPDPYWRIGGTTLGHKINEDGIKPSDAPVSAVRKLVEPGGGEELMRFLGLMTYFSEFVNHFAELAAPLHEALKGTGVNRNKRRGQRLVIPYWQFRWGQRQKRSWEELKEALSSTDVMAPPRRDAEKKLMTDVNSYGLGGFLLQMTMEGRWRPVSLTSRKPTDAGP